MGKSHNILTLRGSQNVQLPGVIRYKTCISHALTLYLSGSPRFRQKEQALFKCNSKKNRRKPLPPARLFLFALIWLSGMVVSPAHAVDFEIKGVDKDKVRDNISLYLNNLDIETGLLADPFWQEEIQKTVSTAAEPFGYYNSETIIEVTDDDTVILQV